MIKLKALVVAVVLVAFGAYGHAGDNGKDKQVKYSDEKVQSGVFPAGELFKSDKFTGRVWLKWLSEKDKVFNCPMVNVTFEPGCRNNWHKHSGGQILLVTGGKGYYQEKGKTAQMLHPGDVVKIGAEVVHWHGAAPDSWFAHIAVETNPATNKVDWQERVTEEQYKEATAAKQASSKISERAVKNHEMLLPNHQSTLKNTDPELIAVFDNFAFDEVWSHDNLDIKTRLMIILASNIACQAVSEYKVMLGAALNVGVSPVEAKEVLYQAVPYVGIAKAFDFISATNEVMTARGIKLPLEPQGTTTPENRQEKGLALQKEIFGDRIDKMYQESPADLIHIQKYLSANCFGDYYTRSGLDIKTRELLTFAILLSLGGCEPQLKGHIAGNEKVGNGRKVLLNAVTQLLPYVGYPRTLNAIKCINEVLPVPPAL